MGRGSYLGGSTIIGPWSGWFSKPKNKVVGVVEQKEQEPRKKKKKKKNSAKKATKIVQRNAGAKNPREPSISKEVSAKAKKRKIARNAEKLKLKGVEVLRKDDLQKVVVNGKTIYTKFQLRVRGQAK